LSFFVHWWQFCLWVHGTADTRALIAMTPPFASSHEVVPLCAPPGDIGKLIDAGVTLADVIAVRAQVCERRFSG
jgi:hypothetical protein